MTARSQAGPQFARLEPPTVMPFAMKSVRYVLASMLLLVVLAGGYASAAEDGFAPLFNGRDLEGWEPREYKQMPADQWTFKDGVLAAKNGQGWLATKREFENFILRLEWRLPTNGNSGIFLRVPPLKEKEQPWTAAVEIQALDDTGPTYVGKIKPYQFSGSIYGAVAPTRSKYRGAGEWNSFEITCRGGKISVVFNGDEVASADMDAVPALRNRARKGVLGLQNHGSSVEFRNVRIKILEP